MNEILMTNIFFTITGISSIVIAIVLIVALVYVIKLVKRLSEISDIVKDETIKVVSDVKEVRANVREHVKTAKNTAGAIFVKKMIEKLFNSK